MSYTNTALSTFRRCPREFELRYEQRLELDTEDREPLLVGQAWHKAHDSLAKGGTGYDAIALHAPSDLWREKLERLFAAYHWYWADQPLEIIEAEQTFRVDYLGEVFEGQRDGIVRDTEGRVGVLEYKTTGEGVDGDAPYWGRLRLDVQVGLYGVTVDPLPDFILYDVVRKPTIHPKRLTKADVSRLQMEIADHGTATYFGATFTAEELAEPLEESRESLKLYGARLTADIGDRPSFYFARRPVPRTHDDYRLLGEDLKATVAQVETARKCGFARNPDSCSAHGRCTFFGFCSNNAHPKASDAAPDGFRKREHLHPELASHNETA